MSQHRWQRWDVAYHRWLYRGGRVNRLGKAFYARPVAWLGRLGVLPRLVTLEVPGRRSGRVVGYPLVVVDEQGERFLVPMLGRDSGWVRNVRANGMQATLRHGRRERVTLVELAPEPRPCALLLQRYLELAPGARPHFPVRVSDPVEAFEGLVERYPIFRVVPV